MFLQQEVVVEQGDERRPPDADALYDRYGAMLFSLALAITASEPDAEEAVIDAFLAAHRGGGCAAGEDTRRRLVFLVRDAALRRRKAGSALRETLRGAHALPRYSFPEPAAQAQRRLEVQRALDSLPDAQLRALNAAFFMGPPAAGEQRPGWEATWALAAHALRALSAYLLEPPPRDG